MSLDWPPNMLIYKAAWQWDSQGVWWDEAYETPSTEPGIVCSDVPYHISLLLHTGVHIYWPGSVSEHSSRLSCFHDIPRSLFYGLRWNDQLWCFSKSLIGGRLLVSLVYLKLFLGLFKIDFRNSIFESIQCLLSSFSPFSFSPPHIGWSRPHHVINSWIGVI